MRALGRDADGIAEKLDLRARLAVERFTQLATGGAAAWTCTLGAVEDDLALVRHAAHEFAGRRISCKPHPCHATNEAQLAAPAREDPPVEIVPPGISLRALARTRPTVVVDASGAGLEAAFPGCEAVTCGASRYAGWGATTDRFPPVDRRRNRVAVQDIHVATMALSGRRFFRSDRRAASVRDVTAHLTSPT